MSHKATELSRRDFVRLAAMSSAMLLASERSLHALDASAPPKKFGSLEPLAPGTVQPEGWLRSYLEKQAAELGSQLPNVSWPFTEPYWAGEEQAESWWPWEQKAYWVDGATRLAIVLGDEKLKRQAQAAIDYTLAHAAADGYLGPTYFEAAKDNCSRWPQTVFFRGLAASADADPDRQRGIADAIRKHYLGDTTPYGKPARNVTNIEGMLWAYERTGDPALLAMAENAWREYMTVAGNEGRGDLSWMQVYSDMPIVSHGVTYAEQVKLPAILYIHTGKPEYLEFAHAGERRIFDHHMLIDGAPSTSEWFATTTALDTHETCDISDHTWSWGAMLLAGGDGVWGDRIERACFNAGPGAIKNDWKAVQYFSGPNQFLATLNSDHNPKTRGGRMMAYQPNPGQRTACCGGNVHRLMPNYVMRMWMRSPGHGLAATLYGPSKVRATVGAHHLPVEITQKTDYPFGERIDLEIQSRHAVSFPLSLRIPAWCSNPRVEVNGAPAHVSPLRSGFVTLDRKFKPGDTVALILPMTPAVSRWPQNGIGVEHGPLVYSLAIKEMWTPIVEPKYTTAEFPSWNAMPASPWNYGLALGPDALEQQVKIDRTPLTDDPWSNPPVTMTVPARKIEAWQLERNPADGTQRFTPPLPEQGTFAASEQVEQILLVPYGSTHLRVTIFPELKPA